jgi:hypothetical protein
LYKRVVAEKGIAKDDIYNIDENGVHEGYKGGS